MCNKISRVWSTAALRPELCRVSRYFKYYLKALNDRITTTRVTSCRCPVNCPYIVKVRQSTSILRSDLCLCFYNLRFRSKSTVHLMYLRLFYLLVPLLDIARCPVTYTHTDQSPVHTGQSTATAFYRGKYDPCVDVTH